MLRAIDNFVLDATEKFATFCNDWLFISQKRLEQINLVLYSIASLALIYFTLALHRSGGFEALMDSIIFLNSYLHHKSDKMQRRVRRFTGVGFRVLWSIVVLVIAVHFHRPTEQVGYFSINIVWCLLVYFIEYVTLLGVDGERGRKAKLSLEKLTELFGRGWSTEPLGGYG